MKIYKARVGKLNASGVVKIKRATYNTINGASVKGGWWYWRGLAWKRDKGHCVACMRAGKAVPGKEVHHIIPVERGGTTSLANLITLCQACHDKRHNHLFRARR